MLTKLDPDYVYPPLIKCLALLGIVCFYFLYPILAYTYSAWSIFAYLLAFIFAIARGIDVYKYSRNRSIIHLTTNMLVFASIGAYLGLFICCIYILIS